MKQHFRQSDDNTRFTIIFLSDGSENGGNSAPILEEISTLMKATPKKPSALYCIGIGSSQDATLLNKIAKAGSEEGNFIYID